MTLYNLPVEDLARQLEEYRLNHRLTKTQMGALFSVEFQVYYSWIKRDSIPKKHLDRARIIVAQKRPITAKDAEILEKFSRLPEKEADLILQMIDGLLKPK